MNPGKTPAHRGPIALLVLVLATLVWSGIGPRDRFTWVLEVFPVLLAIPLLMALYPRWRFPDLVYVLIAGHAIILIIGGHYTYAEVPLFNWLRDSLHLTRNHYDRVGHFAQGFVPAMIARDVLLRRSPLRPGKWLIFIVICICLAISAVYELIEWQAAFWSGTAADAFLGGQGDPWDTQKDMALALVGATLALVLLSRWHDRQMARLTR